MTQTDKTQDNPDPQASPPMADSASDVSLGRGEFARGPRWALVAIGVASIIAGIAAILLPFFASLAAVLTVGWCLVFSGAVGLFAAFRRHETWEMASTFGLSVLAIGVGILMILQPFVGIVALATLIIAWLGASGVLRLWYGLKRRREPGAIWMMLSGLAAFAVALLLWFGFPFNAIWLPGVVLGFDLMLWGALLIVLSRKPARASGADRGGTTEQSS